MPRLHLNGWILAGILFLFVLVSRFEHRVMGLFWSPWAWVESVVTPWNHLLVVAWVSPTAWRFRRQAKGLLVFVQRLFLSLLACEASLVLVVLLDAWLMHQAGARPVRLARLLEIYLTIAGPTMMVLGGLIAARAGVVEENKAVREEALTAKTRLLQSQLHPHVLFNALNGLAELIHRDPPSAERSVQHLADLLRRLLEASEADTLALREERALVEDYLLLEGLRLGTRLRLTWEWDKALDRVQVIPLLIQPLVENAIKHGISPHRSGGDLAVRARPEGRDLLLEVWNTGEPFQEKPGSGIGLRNLQSRLDLHYGWAAQFAVGPSGDGTLAEVRIKGCLDTILP